MHFEVFLFYFKLKGNKKRNSKMRQRVKKVEPFKNLNF